MRRVEWLCSFCSKAATYVLCARRSCNSLRSGRRTVQQLAGMRALEAAIAAGRTRIRPVLMTAAAMIVGMIPMAIGGAGDEQNAFAMLRKRNDDKPAHGVFEEGLP
jgi:hypothetical protein